ncbi:hypothetical protein FA13DRAFT_1733388 [Coprinellus micaceus]|uniref:Uncharacterized protein n=1 Tax=Coprinellus micaceus TaxID=71717 RepID=A0A4Y7STB8_COPMI|nr:hypothetical protein FA13DRAFT_1738738 [Coprinellus micaceus]TEB30965.1 hypothetical protein FA13DRAFT_1733388 [Coprinellus micaceus]
MEPPANLSVLRDWRKYTPTTKGYIQAPLAELKKAKIMELSKCLTTLNDGGALVRKFVYQDAPSPGIAIAGGLLQLPLSTEELDKVTQNGRKIGDSPAFRVDMDGVRETIFSVLWLHI